MLFFKSKKGKKEESKKIVLQNPKILEVNLIKGEIRILFDWQKNITILFAVLFVTGIFVAEIYYGLDWWQKQEIAQAKILDKDIAMVNLEISKIRGMADEALAYKDKSIAVTKILDEHIYWSNFFDWLEKNTLSTVKLGGFSGGTNGIYSLSARALTYAEVSWQVKTFLDDPFVKKAEVISVSAGLKDKITGIDPGTSFTINLEVKPDIFKK